MAGKQERDALARILADPENRLRTAEEIAELCIDAIDEVRARTRRLAVVGQIQFRPQEETHTVILGPFSCRGVLDHPDKLRKAVEGGSAARTAGQGLAWDPKTQTGRGRFMLAPAFMRPRDAWDFHREEEGRPEWWRICKDPRAYARIAASVADWEAGKWAARYAQERP